MPFGSGGGGLAGSFDRDWDRSGFFIITVAGGGGLPREPCCIYNGTAEQDGDEGLVTHSGIPTTIDTWRFQGIDLECGLSRRWAWVASKDLELNKNECRPRQKRVWECGEEKKI